MKGDDVEESQFRVSATLAGERLFWEGILPTRAQQAPCLPDLNLESLTRGLASGGNAPNCVDQLGDQ